MKSLSDEQRKLLIEYLGECWHKWVPYCDGWYCQNCKIENESYLDKPPCNNRGFDCYEDFGALKDKMVAKEDWDEFENFATTMWLGDPDAGRKSFSCWLFRPESCELVADFLKGKAKKKNLIHKASKKQEINQTIEESLQLFNDKKIEEALKHLIKKLIDINKNDIYTQKIKILLMQKMFINFLSEEDILRSILNCKIK